VAARHWLTGGITKGGRPVIRAAVRFIWPDGAADSVRGHSSSPAGQHVSIKNWLPPGVPGGSQFR
jgi:hypothetical protein